MITILKQPYICSLTRNPIDFQVKTDMYFDGVTIYPEILIRVNSIPAIGTTYTFQWTNTETNDLEQITLVAKNGTSAANYPGPYEIPGTGYGGSLSEWIDVVIGKLKALRLFNANYIPEKSIRFTVNRIRITAMQACEELRVTFESNQATTHLEIIENLNDYYVPEIRSQYSMKALIYFEKEYESGAFELVSSIDCVVDNDSIAHVDISSTLNAEIEATWNEYPVPWKQKRVYKAPNLKRYYVKFIETWENEPDYFSTVSDVLLAHWGGVSTDEHLLGDAVTLNADGGNWLTSFSSGKSIAKNQSDWLGWMNRETDFTYDLHCVITTNAAVYDVVLDVITLKSFETVIFNTGYEVNDLESEITSGEIIKKWTFYVGMDDTPVSPMFTYYPDENCVRKVLCFFNSYGIPETFNTSGEWIENMSTSSEIASRAGYFNLNSLFPQNFIFDSKHGTSYNAVTGILDNESARRLKPMINSLITFLQEGSLWIPAIINNSKTRIMKLNDFQQQIELEIMKANEDDRSSFIGPQMDVIQYNGNGIEYLELVSNGIEIQTYGNIQLILGTMLSGGVIVDTFVWDAVDGLYYPTAPLQDDGEYRLEGTITGVDGTLYKIKKIIRYKRREIVLRSYDTGAVSIALRSENTSDEVVIDWGDSNSVTATYSGASQTTIAHTYTVSGRKMITLKKPSFDDVIEFSAYNDFGVIDFAKMPNLKKVYYINGPSGNIYFGGLSELTHIDVRSAAITSISIGYQKNLQFLTTEDLAFTEEGIISLFRELWRYRKLYVNTPAVYILNLGFPAPDEVNNIINGTGEYALEGLDANYGWTIMIT